MDEAEEGGGRESKKNEKKKQRKCDKDGETETGEEETEGMKELEMVDSPRCVCVWRLHSLKRSLSFATSGYASKQQQ